MNKKRLYTILGILFIFGLISAGEASQYQLENIPNGMSNTDANLYQDILTADLIVRGTLYDQISFENPFSDNETQTEGKIDIKEILKQANKSHVTEGMTIKEYMLGGTIGNISVCNDQYGCPRSNPTPHEGIYFLGFFDSSGQGRYSFHKVNSLPLEDLIPAIYNVEHELPIKTSDRTLFATLKRELEKKDNIKV